MCEVSKGRLRATFEKVKETWYVKMPDHCDSLLPSYAIPWVQIDRDIMDAVLYQIEERSSTLALSETEHALQRTRD